MRKAPGTMFVPGAGGKESGQPQKEVGHRTYHTGAKNHGDGTEMKLTQQEEGSHKNHCLNPAEVGENDPRHIRLEHSQQQDRQPGGGDEGHHRRTQGRQDGLYPAEVAVLIVEMGQGQTDKEGGDNAAQRTQQHPGHTAQTHAHKGGRVDGDGAGGHLRDGDKIGKLCQSHQAVNVHDLVLDKGDGGIAAAHAEHANLDKRQEQLIQNTHLKLPPFLCCAVPEPDPADPPPGSTG